MNIVYHKGKPCASCGNITEISVVVHTETNGEFDLDMAKIIVYGDINISALYLRINGGKEVTVTGKHPKSFTISAGTNHIFATTVTKLERASNRLSDGGFASKLTAAVQDSTNTTLGGELEFGEDDVLLIEVKQKGLKTVVYNKLVSAAEANDYVYMDEVVEYGTKKSGRWIKWLILVLGFFGLLLFLAFMFVFMAEMNV